MRSDPRTGLHVCYAIAGLAGVWMLANMIATDALYAWLGSDVYPITFVAFFLGLSALAVGLLLFGRYARVKADLLAGRHVIARWTAGRDIFTAVGAAAEAAGRAEKRGALYLILLFVAVVFGAFALYDLEAAPVMLAIGGAVLVVILIAFAISDYVLRKQLEFRNGHIIVGRDGLLINDVLHVWNSFMASLDGAEFVPGAPDVLVVTYSTSTRSGRQVIRILLPVPPEHGERARQAAQQLLAIYHLAPRRQAQKPRLPEHPVAGAWPRS